MNCLELQRVCYTYSKGTPYEHEALSDIDLSVKAGVLTGVIGRTGCGKSTLVQMFNGLLRPDSGKVLLFGEDIWEKPKEIRSIRFRVGLVMQYPEYQLFDETVRSDIAFGPKNMGLDDAQISERVQRAASFVGLDPAVLDRAPFDLSGGQRRRAAIAGVIAMQPQVLVLDEPAAGLDPRGRREILGGLRAFCDESGTSVILVSHSMEDMAEYCDEIIVMNDSHIEMHATADEVFSRGESLAAMGLDVPEVTRIVKLLENRGYHPPCGIYTPAGAAEWLLSLLSGKEEAQ